MIATCNTCCKPASHPFREYDHATGKVHLGCIDAFHNDALIAGTESSRWHNRTEAKRMRVRAEYCRKHGYAPKVSP